MVLSAGEGSVVLVLEVWNTQRRGATILAEIVGYGNTCDAYHMTSPHPEGLGAIKASEISHFRSRFRAS